VLPLKQPGLTKPKHKSLLEKFLANSCFGIIGEIWP
jgi:hypothetical protein